MHNFKQRLETIFGRSVNRGHILDFVRLTERMRQTLAGRLRMVYTGDNRQELFTSHAWRRLFEIQGTLVREFILEFLSTCRMSDAEMGLDVVDTLSFLVEDKHLRRHAEGRNNGARLFRGHFIGRLAAHFGLVSDEGLRGLLPSGSSEAADDWAYTPKAARDAPAVDEGALANPAPMQAPQPPRAIPRTMPQRISRLEEEDAIWRILGFGIRRIDYVYRPCCKEINELVMVYSEKDVC
ncbi:hypothetical protein Tco_1102669 [Tanacetum coccineum]